MEIQDISSLKAVKEKNGYYLSHIEDALKHELEKYSWSRFYRPLLYALQGGKRVRPLILLLSSDAVGGRGEEPLPASVAIELLHTESIIHDDIIDQEASRRNRLAFHVRYGYGASLLTADFVFGMILDIASRYSSTRIAEELSSAALRMCEGEFRELKIDPSAYTTTWHEYVDIISQKTASLFQTAAKIGAMIGKGGDEEVSALSSYGLHLGVAYQIQDDIIDWGREGKITKALHLNGEENVLNHMKKVSRRYALQAKYQLKTIKECVAKECLGELAEFAVSRPC